MEIQLLSNLVNYSPVGVLIIGFMILVQGVRMVNKLIAEQEQTLAIIRKERYQTEKYREKMFNEISVSKSQHAKIETMLEIIHQDIRTK